MVEGDAELILIPAMFKAVFGLSLDELGISLINMSSTVFTNIALIFTDERIRRRCAIITDLDTSIVPLSDDKNEDDEFERKCRNSQEAGLNRKSIIDEFCEDNHWLRPFYADYTFEVDFLMNENSYEIIKTLDTIYKIKSYREKSKKLLKSKNVAVAGKEVLRLANGEGKGWFALLVAEYLAYNTYIPEYILQAIAFACSHINESHFESIIKFRINQGIANDEVDFKKLSKRLDVLAQNDYKVSDLIEIYEQELPDDQLTLFINWYKRLKNV